MANSTIKVYKQNYSCLVIIMQSLTFEFEAATSLVNFVGQKKNYFVVIHFIWFMTFQWSC